MSRGEMLGHAAEVAGLGILAAPHLKHAITKKPVSKKTERNTELAGLGVLAAPSAYHLWKGAKPFLKRGSVDSKMMTAFSDELTKIAGPFDRAARMAQQAKGIVAQAPAKLKMPGSMIRGKPMTGTPVGHIAAGASIRGAGPKVMKAG